MDDFFKTYVKPRQGLTDFEFINSTGAVMMRLSHVNVTDYEVIENES